MSERKAERLRKKLTKERKNRIKGDKIRKDPRFVEGDLELMTVEELKGIAQKIGLPRYTCGLKDDLIQALTEFYQGRDAYTIHPKNKEVRKNDYAGRKAEPKVFREYLNMLKKNPDTFYDFMKNIMLPRQRKAIESYREYIKDNFSVEWEALQLVEDNARSKSVNVAEEARDINEDAEGLFDGEKEDVRDAAEEVIAQKDEEIKVDCSIWKNKEIKLFKAILNGDYFGFDDMLQDYPYINDYYPDGDRPVPKFHEMWMEDLSKLYKLLQKDQEIDKNPVRMKRRDARIRQLELYFKLFPKSISRALGIFDGPKRLKKEDPVIYEFTLCPKGSFVPFDEQAPRPKAKITPELQKLFKEREEYEKKYGKERTQFDDGTEKKKPRRQKGVAPKKGMKFSTLEEPPENEEVDEPVKKKRGRPAGPLAKMTPEERKKAKKEYDRKRNQKIKEDDKRFTEMVKMEKEDQPAPKKATPKKATPKATPKETEKEFLSKKEQDALETSVDKKWEKLYESTKDLKPLGIFSKYRKLTVKEAREKDKDKEPEHRISVWIEKAMIRKLKEINDGKIPRDWTTANQGNWTRTGIAWNDYWIPGPEEPAPATEEEDEPPLSARERRNKEAWENLKKKKKGSGMPKKKKQRLDKLLGYD